MNSFVIPPKSRLDPNPHHLLCFLHKHPPDIHNPEITRSPQKRPLHYLSLLPHGIYMQHIANAVLSNVKLPLCQSNYIKHSEMKLYGRLTEIAWNRSQKLFFWTRGGSRDRFWHIVTIWVDTGNLLTNPLPIYTSSCCGANEKTLWENWKLVTRPLITMCWNCGSGARAGHSAIRENIGSTPTPLVLYLWARHWTQQLAWQPSVCVCIVKCFSLWVHHYWRPRRHRYTVFTLRFWRHLL